jgi:hypothetical protein
MNKINKAQLVQELRNIQNCDLRTREGRIEALIEIANICMDGVLKSVVINKTGEVEIVPSQEPQIAINAIRMIDELSNEDGSQMTVNLTIKELER